MAPKHPKLPRDPSQRAKALLDMATGCAPKTREIQLSAAQKVAQQGGLKGGKARAVALDKETRSIIAKKAAQVRWGRKNGHD